MGINHIALIGSLVKGPEKRYTSNGIPTTTFTLAVTRTQREGATGELTMDYIQVVAWRKLAETLGDTLKKGNMVSVEGRILTRTIEGPMGQRKKTVEIEAIFAEAVTSLPPRQAPELAPGILGEGIDEIPL